MGWGGFPPPVPLPCPAGGGAQSEPRGRSNSRPFRGTTSLGMSRRATPYRRKLFMFEDIPGVSGEGSLTGTILLTRYVTAMGHQVPHS